MPSFRLDDKIALVTGASAGLGAAIAVALAEAGASVAVHGNTRSPAGTCARVAALGRQAVPITGNLTDPAEPDRLVADTLGRFGRLDILVNNAGAIRRSPAAELTDDDWRYVVEVTLSSVFRLCRAAARHWLGEGAPGKIVNIASLLSFQGGITVSPYAAAKGGVAQLTKALANEWASRGINVNAIAPGYMITDNTAPLRADAERSRQILERIPAGRWGNPEDVAGAAVFLASQAASYVHGHVLVVDGGWMGR